MAIDKITSAGLTTSTNQPNFRNIIINGDMSIAQRSTSVSSITTSGYNTVDRFRTFITTLGTWTESQSTDVPTGQGFAKSLKIDCTTADASPAAGDRILIQQRIEGQNLQYLKKGTSSAESTTVSFWVKSAKTGTYIVELYDNDNSRQISNSYTISSANTWEKKTITYAGDTTGAFDNNSSTSLILQFWLASGTDYTSGTLSTSWSSVTNANRAVGQVNLGDSTSNEWYVTGVQLEAGTTASDFEFLPYDVNLQRCHRYLFTLTSPSGQGRFGSGGFINTTSADTIVSLPVEMRTTYSMSYSALSHFRLTSHTEASALSSLALETSRVLNAADLRATATTAIGTAGNYALLYTNGSDSKMFFDAEL